MQLAQVVTAVVMSMTVVLICNNVGWHEKRKTSNLLHSKRHLG